MTTTDNIHPWLARLEHVGDLMPCQVVLPGTGRLVQRARVLVYRSHIFVLEHDRMKEHPELTAMYPLTAEPVLPPSHIPRRNQQAHLETNQGTVHVQMLTGCGCGSALKLLSPIDAVTWAQAAGYVL